jgi:putative addiction module antidote
MASLKIRKIGNSLGVILPAEIIEQFNFRENDILQLSAERDGLYMSLYNAEFEEWAEAYRKTERKHRNVLRELAK